jgi:signal recognition particle receptor subunit beta
MVIRSPLRLTFLNDEQGHVPNELRIVYCGIGFAGKTSNLLALARFGGSDGTQVSWSTPYESEAPNTIWYDRLQLSMQHRDQNKAVQIYSLPGQIGNPNAWKLVLQISHGVVFVVDSQLERIDANVEMSTMLDSVVSALDPPRPIVIQYNKRDLPNAADSQTLSQAVNLRRHPEFEAVAPQSAGVRESLVGLIKELS